VLKHVLGVAQQAFDVDLLDAGILKADARQSDVFSKLVPAPVFSL
jgi:hypothetical protein